MNKPTVVRISVGLLLQLHFAVCIENQSGHLQSIGNHQPPIDQVNSLKQLESSHFYKNYVLKNQPVLIKNVMINSKPASTWKDDYLASMFGDQLINVDKYKYENRSGQSEEMLLKYFLDVYKQTLNLYLISSLPLSMQQEFPFPPCMQCQEFTQRIQDFVLWFSYGNTNSHLHFDNVENLYCQLDGTKHWFMVDPENGSSHIPLDNPEGQYCGVNVSAVDMNAYPGLQTVPWWEAVTHPGDCLYVPLNWWHQVRSDFGRNMAVNIWWAPFLDEYKAIHTECSEIFDNRYLSDVKFTYGEWIKWRLANFLKENGGNLSFKAIRKSIVHEHTGELLITRASFNVLDTNKDGLLEYSEFIQHPLDVIHASVKYVEIGAMTVASNSYDTDQDEAAFRKYTNDEL